MAGQIFLALLALVVGLMLFLQWRLARHSRDLRGQPAPAGLPSHPEGALYYFFSPRCAPCRRMGPLIDDLAATHPGRVHKIDVSREPGRAAAFRVAATPTTLLVRDGRIVEVLLGARPRQQVAALLEE